MTITKRIFMLMATCCLIVLLTASFAMAEEILPPDDILVEAALVLNKYLKGVIVLGKYKSYDNSKYHKIVFKYEKNNEIAPTPLTLIKLDTGIWILGTAGGGFGWVEIHKTDNGFVVMKKK
ncbi:hypothetical protein ACFLZI_01780 [Nitrospirota bacterium]